MAVLESVDNSSQIQFAYGQTYFSTAVICVCVQKKESEKEKKRGTCYSKENIVVVYSKFPVQYRFTENITLFTVCRHFLYKT